MTGHDSFDATPDVALGRLLREHLDAGDDAPFLARLRSAITAERATSWEVLAGWARPGLVAAATIVIGLSLWLSAQRDADIPTLADAIQPSGAPARILAGAQETQSDVVLVSWMEEQ